MKPHLLVYIITLASIKIVYGTTDGKYPSSLPTLTEVPDCPRNKDDWDQAAARKHCDRVQNSDNTTFVYHCLINEWANATVEVCAPTWYISGYCAMYSSSNARVIDNDNYDCTLYVPPCPRRYPSSEAYKYGVCYDIVWPPTTVFTPVINVTQESSTESTTTESIHLPPDEFTTTHWILVTVIPVVFIIALSVGSFFLYKMIVKKRKAEKSNVCVDEVEKDPLDPIPSDKSNVCVDEVEKGPLDPIPSDETDRDERSEHYKYHYTTDGIKKKMNIS